MRILPVCLLALAAAVTSLSAGRLDIAVIQFPEDKTPDELNAAMASTSLFEMTNSSRTMTSEAYLKGGYVIFAQSLSASPGTKFTSATRIKDQRADVDGTLGSGTISVEITLMEGVKAGLRSFDKRVYSGNAPLEAGSPRILSMRQIRGKAPNVVKGQAKMNTYNLTTVVVAQYTP